MASTPDDPAPSAHDPAGFATAGAGVAARAPAADGQGRPAPGPHAVPLDFTFEYRGFPFTVRAEPGDHGGRVRLEGSLGTLPYSAEAPARRADLLAIIAAAGRTLGGRMRLSPGQRILLCGDIRFDAPLTDVAVISGTARLLVEAKPFLDLVSRVLAAPAAAGHGARRDGEADGGPVPSRSPAG